MLLAGTLGLLALTAALRRRLAEQTAVTRRQNEELMRLSFEDGLTGLANRRQFDASLALELARAARSQTPISLLMIDIDHFKALNDALGHQQGDGCLVRVAAALRSASVRAGDLIARYGGEEFGVILPMSDEKAAFATAERMRAAVHDLAVDHPTSGCCRYVTISIGAATLLPDRSVSPKTMIALADEALYYSKQNGRNRTTCSVGMAGTPEPAAGTTVR